MYRTKWKKEDSTTVEIENPGGKDPTKKESNKNKKAKEDREKLGKDSISEAKQGRGRELSIYIGTWVGEKRSKVGMYVVASYPQEKRKVQ